jgi:putative ABC transport system permease protein
VDAIQLDVPVLALALGITLLAALLAGLMPAIRTASDGLAGTVQWAGRGAVSSRGHRLRSALVVGQLALAVVLLHGAGLLVNSFIRLTAVDPGFHSHQVLSFRIDLPATAYRSEAQVQSFFTGLLERVAQHPGVVSIAANSRPPIGGGSFSSRFRIHGQPIDGEAMSIGVRIITPAYFETIGVALQRGRGLTDGDQAGTLPVVVINQAAAARFFPSEDPIGRQLAGFGYDAIEEAANAFTVVGIAGNVRSRGLSEPPQPEAYFAHAQVPLRQMHVFVRSAGNPLAHVSAIRTEIRALDRDLPMPEFRALDQVVADSLDRPRFFTALLGIFSAVALALAGVGVFGLLSFTVARRTREIAVRVALGASPAILLSAIARHTSLLMGLGLAIGLLGVPPV